MERKEWLCDSPSDRRTIKMSLRNYWKQQKSSAADWYPVCWKELKQRGWVWGCGVTCSNSWGRAKAPWAQSRARLCRGARRELIRVPKMLLRRRLMEHRRCSRRSCPAHGRAPGRGRCCTSISRPRAELQRSRTVGKRGTEGIRSYSHPLPESLCPRVI